MELLNTIRDSISPTLAALVEQAGVPCTVYRKTPGADASDGTPRYTFVADATLTGLHGFFALIDTQTAQRRYGVKSEASAVITIPLTVDNALVRLAPDDGLEITGGPFTGWRFQAEADSKPDVTGAFTVTALKSAKRGLW